MKKGIDYIGITVCFYCHDGKGNLLLQKRSSNCRDEQGAWDCGGGSMNFGETFEEAVRREIKEEFCCVPQELHFSGVQNVLRMNNSVQSHWIAVIFAARLNPNEVAIGDPDKMEEIQWFRLNSLPTPLHSMYLQHFQYAKKFIEL